MIENSAVGDCFAPVWKMLEQFISFPILLVDLVLEHTFSGQTCPGMWTSDDAQKPWAVHQRLYLRPHGLQGFCFESQYWSTVRREGGGCLAKPPWGRLGNTRARRRTSESAYNACYFLESNGMSYRVSFRVKCHHRIVPIV